MLLRFLSWKAWPKSLPMTLCSDRRTSRAVLITDRCLLRIPSTPLSPELGTIFPATAISFSKVPAKSRVTARSRVGATASFSTVPQSLRQTKNDVHHLSRLRKCRCEWSPASLDPPFCCHSRQPHYASRKGLPLTPMIGQRNTW